MGCDVIENWPSEQRFDKPAVHVLVDLINRSYGLKLAPESVSLLEVESLVPDELTTADILQRATFPTRAKLHLQMNDQEVEVFYHRLLLPCYLYRRALMVKNPDLPMLITDSFVSKPHTVTTDALSYIRREHRVLLTAEECTIEEFPQEVALDGSWPVLVTPIAEHPVWVGPIVLHVTAA